jgi:hypothetical protein
MRGVLVMVLLACTASCPRIGPATDPDSCDRDSDCSGDHLCARNAACLPPSQIHAVHVTWTLEGMPANQTTCTSRQSLEIEFRGGVDDEPLGYAPVPCVAGKFSVDKLPTSFTLVEIGHRGQWQSATIDATTDEVAFDLPL